MACPHGLNSTPTTCSQCIGAKPTRVEVVDGHLVIDGKVGRTLQEVNRARYNEETDATRPQAKKTCGICRQPGHNSSTCTNAPREAVERLNDDDSSN